MPLENARNAAGSMQAIYDVAPGQGADAPLVIMLPGAMQRPQDIVREGFVTALRVRRLPIRVAIADVHAGYYLDRNVVERLTEDIVVPARAQGTREIWLMGISLGGLGALMCARAHPEHVDGVIVLAPYLGVAGMIDEVVRAGGLRTWRAGHIAHRDDERRVLDWLRDQGVDDSRPPIYLGYGAQDRFMAASRLLGECLPTHHVASLGGGHDWATWRALWELLLDRGLFRAA